MARMMSPFPATVTRYMPRKSANRRLCFSFSLVSPRRMNSETVVWFLWFIFLLIGRKEDKVFTFAQGKPEWYFPAAAV